jgi:hypothetical protein
MRTLVALSLLSAGCASAPVQSPSDLQKVAGQLAAWRTNLAERRAHNLGVLRDYIAAGRFPRNRDNHNTTPVFVDEYGVRCAVAEMIHDGGHYTLVSRVRQTNNRVKIMDITDGPVRDWILTSGLTQEECALIQPSYPCDPPLTKAEAEAERQRMARELEALRLWLLAEVDRLRQHLSGVLRKLEADTDASLDLALERLLKACSPSS